MSSLLIAATPAIHRTLLITLLGFAAGIFTASHIASVLQPKKESMEPAISECSSEGIIIQLNQTHFVIRSHSIAQLATCIDRNFFRFGSRWDSYIAIKDHRIPGFEIKKIQTGNWPVVIGIKSGDLIEKIDGVSMDTHQFMAACSKIRSKFAQDKLFTIQLSLIRQEKQIDINYYVVR